MRSEMARSWHVVFWRGAIAMAFAIVAFAWPIMTLSALVLLFGLFAAIDGALALALATRDARKTPLFKPLVVEGAVSVLAGAIAVFAPRAAGLLLVILIGLWAIGTGVLEIVTGWTLRRASADEGSLLLGGAASVVFGLVVILRPGAGAVALTWLLGLYALIFGALLVGLSIRLRRGTRHLPALR